MPLPLESEHSKNNFNSHGKCLAVNLEFNEGLLCSHSLLPTSEVSPM